MQNSSLYHDYLKSPSVIDYLVISLKITYGKSLSVFRLLFRCRTGKLHYLLCYLFNKYRAIFGREFLRSRRRGFFSSPLILRFVPADSRLRICISMAFVSVGTKENSRFICVRMSACFSDLKDLNLLRFSPWTLLYYGGISLV